MTAPPVPWRSHRLAVLLVGSFITVACGLGHGVDLPFSGGSTDADSGGTASPPSSNEDEGDGDISLPGESGQPASGGACGANTDETEPGGAGGETAWGCGGAR